MEKLNYDELPILPCLEDNLARIKEIYGGSSDVLVNEFTARPNRIVFPSLKTINSPEFTFSSIASFEYLVHSSTSGRTVYVAD